MGKQGFEMAVEVCTADDILWTKFLLLLPKLLYSRGNNHSNDCANIEMGDNWRKALFNTKVEASTKERQIYYTKDLSLEWTYILPITVKLVLFQVNMFLQSGYLIRSRSKFSNHWMTGNWKFLWKFNKLSEPTQSKLLYVDEEPQNDLEVIHKSHF